ncbi:MAG: dimethylarginine dimethylaminohydrolase family protein [Deltaproteobacteria bacterium]
MSLIAVTRPVSGSLPRCEISFIKRDPIDVPLACRQHAAYEQALERAGARVVRLPAADDHPDATFVEDAALVLDEVAVIPIMGALSRRGETVEVERCLSAYRPIARLVPPATLDGGDVMRVERRIFVGLTARTNQAAVEQLRAITRPYGYQVTAVAPKGCLHLKSACTYLGRGIVLGNPEWLDGSCLGGSELLPVAPEEPFGANAVAVGGKLVYAAGYSRTLARLEQHGFDVITVETGELRKAESAMTCMSLVFEA